MSSFLFFAATELYYWGAPESSGQTTSGEVTSPLSGDKVVLDLSAGSQYSLVLLEDGTVQSAGYIESMDDYHGHLGLKEGDIAEGSNPFQTVSSVFDQENDAILDAPSFTRVIAGADQETATGSIHSMFIDTDGQVWATGSNAKGELCLGDFDDRLLPTKVAMQGRIIDVAIGAEHTLLLHEDGSVVSQRPFCT